MRPREVWARLVHNWPAKLLTFLIAFVLWYQLRENEPVVDRTFVRELQVIGLGEDRVAVGLPEAVLVRVRGTARRVETLSPNAVVPFIDLSRVEGETFDQRIQIQLPPGIQVVDIVPDRLIGSIEPLGEALLPVEVFSPGVGLRFSPNQVRARGPDREVQRAVAAIGLELRGENEVTLYAVDAAGRPVPGLVLEPGTARITARAPLLVERAVPLRLEPPPAGLRLVEARLPTEVTVVGPPEALDGLEFVPARAEWREGSYVAPLALELPDGVRASGEVWGRFRVERAEPVE